MTKNKKRDSGRVKVVVKQKPSVKIIANRIGVIVGLARAIFPWF